MGTVSVAAALVALAALLVGAALAMISPRFHGVLKAVVTGVWILSVAFAAWAVYALFAGTHAGGTVTIIGYLITIVALMPLFGIGRLGEPGAIKDPDAPVLAPDQIAKVDAGAAIIIGIAWAVVVWRLSVLLA